MAYFSPSLNSSRIIKGRATRSLSARLFDFNFVTVRTDHQDNFVGFGLARLGQRLKVELPAIPFARKESVILHDGAFEIREVPVRWSPRSSLRSERSRSIALSQPL